MKKLAIEPLIEFLKTLTALQQVERVMHVPGKDRYENDVEHSYLLAMCIWYLVENFKLPLDRDKAVRYALAHDVAEVYAGDTYAFATPSHKESKKAREAAARERLAKELPELRDLHESMSAYENQSDPEAIFVRAIDKLMPIMTNYLQDGRTLKERKVSYKDFVALKRATTAKSPEATELLAQLIALIDKDRGVMFEDRIED